MLHFPLCREKATGMPRIETEFEFDMISVLSYAKHRMLFFFLLLFFFVFFFCFFHSDLPSTHCTTHGK